MSQHQHLSEFAPTSAAAGAAVSCKPLHLRLLGSPELAVVDGPPGRTQVRALPLRPQALRVLAALCLGGPRPRLSVADLLWDTESARALHNLRMTLHDLRRALGPHADWLRAEGSTLSVDLSRCCVDALNLSSRRGEALLGAWTGPLMDGYRTGGTGAWLDWLRCTEARLLNGHLERLRREARTAPPELAARLLERLGDLQARTRPHQHPDGQHPDEPDEPTFSGNLGAWHGDPAMLGRNAELRWLRRGRGALHLCGPPGSGRTALAGAAWPDALWIRGALPLRDMTFGAVRASLPNLPDLPPQRLESYLLDRQLAGIQRVIVDDLEDLDGASSRLCAALVGRAAAGTGPPTLLISRSGQTPDFLRDVPCLTLGLLADQDFRELTARLTNGWAQTEAAATHLHAELRALTGGLPGLLTRLLRPVASPQPAPPTLADAVRRRLGDLTPDQHALLASAYVLPGASPTELRALLSPDLSGPLGDALAGLERLHWWREDRPTHPQLAQWAWTGWPWLQRQALGERAAALSRARTESAAWQALEHGRPAESLGLLRARRRDSAALCAAEALSAYQLALTVDAEAAARRSLGLDPAGRPAALSLDVLANLAVDQGRYHAARTLARQAFQAHPEAPGAALYTAAYLADLLGTHPQAERLARSGLARLSPAESPAPLLAVLASSLDARGRFAEARHWHRAALDSARAGPSAHMLCEVISFYAWHLNAAKQPREAERLTREGLSLGRFDNAGHLRNSLGQALLLQGRLDGTLEELEPQLRLPNTTLAAIAHARQALALHRMGQPQAARTALDHGAALLPLTEAGHPRYAWAVAALTIQPGELGPQAARTVRGVRTNDYDLVQQFRRLTGR